MRRIGLLLLGLAVAGCASQQLDRGLTGLIGLNIHRAVDILGPPDGQGENQGDLLYTWSAKRNALLFNTGITAPGVSGDSEVYGSISSAGGPVNGTTISTDSTTLLPKTTQCSILIATDKSGTIKRYQVDGNLDACQSYASRFR